MSSKPSVSLESVSELPSIREKGEDSEGEPNYE